VLLGDVSGNWAPNPVQAAPEQINGSAVLSLEDLLAESGERITVTLSAGLTEAQFYAADLALVYDPAILTFVSATAGAGVPGYMTAVKESEPGRLSLALAGATPSTVGGELLTLTFDVVGSNGSSPLVFHRAELNEGQIGVQTNDGSVTVAQRATFTITPGWNLLTWPLLLADVTLDGSLGAQLHGSDSPDTADRVLYWDAATQSYQSAWFCGGPVCESWGEPYANRWLASDYSPSTITLPPNAGFWIQNRSGDSETLTILGVAVEGERSVPVAQGWQMLGSIFAAELPLDEANLPATGADSPDTADRVLYWDAAAQSYKSAWFCGGPVCESWGEPYANRWLASDYSPTDIVIQPGHGFWYQNRHQPFTWINER
jgi:hypothetical protein